MISTERRILGLEAEVRSLRSDLESEREIRSGSEAGLANILQVCGWIILVVLAANYLGIYVRLNLIGERIQKGLREDSEKREEALNKKIDERFQGNSLRLGKRFRFLEGTINRAFAQAHWEEPGVSFIWWMRAAGRYEDAENLGNALDMALSALRKVSMRPFLQEHLQEAQKILNEISTREMAKQFEIQIKLIREQIERIMREEPPRATPKPEAPGNKPPAPRSGN